MIKAEEMRDLMGKKIKLLATNDKVFEGICHEYHQAEDEDEEPMIFVGERYAFRQ